ncbi:MAG: hypothetical protein MUE82_11960 [Chloroflexi bacterium]|jgi:tetratricopeptide (TPR) repeat protein|nr:hypothetical protein [Chloroflexota bacterium]
MIEHLLEADRLLALGLPDRAERIYWQAVETDPRNAIAVVGLARVASERGDDRTALEFARKALAIDPENPAAIRLTARLAEIIATREAAGATTAASGTTGAPADATGASGPPSEAPAAQGPARPAPVPRRAKRHGLLGRLLGGR